MAGDKDTRKGPEGNDKNLSTMPNVPNENRPPSVNRVTPTRDAYWFAHGGLEDLGTVNIRKNADAKDTQLQRERDRERIRAFQEQKEEERLRRFQKLQDSFELARKQREQQEEERRRKIEEAKIKESERRLQVEERKRQIWEAEQERKSAILRRNLERETRIEARRNAQRNSASFAFGSSTPRTFDLDLAALGKSSCPLMSSVSARRSEERDFGAKRATSSCSLDRKTDYLDLSTSYECDKQQWRSSSVEPSHMTIAKQIAIEHMKSEQTKACLTMWNDNSVVDHFSSRRNSFNESPSTSRWLIGPGALVGEDCMSWSMTSLSSSSRGRRRTDLTPTVISRERSMTPHATPRAKDTSCSPSRPQSAMSGKSELSVGSSQASGVVYRPRPIAPRKPRPVSIAGTTVDKHAWSSSSYERPSRPIDQNATVPKTTPRARSKEPESKHKPIPPPRKPLPPPKSAQVLAKARSHPVPTKDNLRKVKGPDSSNKVSSSENSECSENLPLVVSADSTTSSSDVGAAKTSVSSTSSEKQVPVVEGDDSNHNDPVDAKQEPASAKQEPASVKQEPVSVKQEPVSVKQEPVSVKQEPVSAPVKQPEDVNVESTSNENEQQESSSTKPRITSEEEAKALLAEKRRIAREQAEREAELERQRQEELRRQEEERKRQEELEQKRQEEEQIRLAELHRKLEEEKLRKAIEEQEQRELEEQARREEEAKMKAEKEEQERKSREEALKQRLELEEKLRKEEQERAERKRRVEQIMSRTRIRGSQSADALSGGVKPTDSVTASQSFMEGKIAGDVNVMANSMVTSTTMTSILEGTGTSVIKSVSLGDGAIIGSRSQNIQSSDQQTVEQFGSDSVISSGIKNGFGASGDNNNQSDVKTSDVNSVPNRTSDSTAAMHTNGYTNHEDSSFTFSTSEERSDKLETCDGVLLNVQSSNSAVNNVVKETHIENSSQLIDLGMGETTTVSRNNNYMFNVDIVNSNIGAADPFHAMGDGLLKKQETITDLLS